MMFTNKSGIEMVSWVLESINVNWDYHTVNLLLQTGMFVMYLGPRLVSVWVSYLSQILHKVIYIMCKKA